MSYKIMQKFNHDEIIELLGQFKISQLQYEEYDKMKIYVLAIHKIDQIWLVKYGDNLVLMFSSEY